MRFRPYFELLKTMVLFVHRPRNRDYLGCFAVLRDRTGEAGGRVCIVFSAVEQFAAVRVVAHPKAFRFPDAEEESNPFLDASVQNLEN